MSGYKLQRLIVSHNIKTSSSKKLLDTSQSQLTYTHPTHMTTPKYNKFNTGKTKDYFQLKRWRFNTEKYPVIVSKDKCASSTAKTLFSTQELQMLVELTNTLQCNQRKAVRIALYEASISLHKAYNSDVRHARSESTEKAHQGRYSANR